MNRLRNQLMETSPEKDFERIHKLMPLVPPAALHDFLLQYASEHADFRKLWRDWLEARFMPRGNSADDLRKCVAAVFNSTPVLPDTHGPWGEDDCLDWEMLGGSMRQLMKNAADAPPDATLAMAFEFMRQLDAHNDVELSGDGWMEVEEIAYQLLDKITAYIRNGDVPIAGRRAALDQLADIAKLPVYREVGLCDMDDLLVDLRIAVLEADEALRMLDEQIEHAEEIDRDRLVLRKFELLVQLKRNGEAEELLRRFRRYCDVRRKLVELLMQANRYEEGMKELDDAIKEEEKRPYGIAIDWREMQCHYAAMHKDMKRLLPLLRILFIESGGGIKYYRELHKVIPTAEWPQCLERLISEVRERPVYNNWEVAEIYLREKLPQRVVEVVPRNCEECLGFICHYAPKLKDITAMLGMFAEAARGFARSCADRKAYKTLARFMEQARKLPGGRDCVQSLVAEFRTAYRRRSAMLEELKRF